MDSEYVVAPTSDELVRISNWDLLAEATLATMNTWERYTIAKHILATAGSIHSVLPPLPSSIQDDLCQAVSSLVAHIADDAVYEYLYDDQDRWMSLMEGDDLDDEWMLA